MEECISSRTRSSLSSDSLNDWKICDDKFKIPKRTPSKISNSAKYKKEIISSISKEIDISVKKYETSIHELNYLQSGNIFAYFYKVQLSNENKSESQNNKIDSDYEISKKYFIDDSDDSDPEYIESDEIIKRVNAERCILNRVEELKSNNLWSSKMISKKPDPVKPTFHWDCLIKEIPWLQGNMVSVKQNKRIDAKKLATAASKFIKDKEAQMAKINKEETIKAKKHCLNISKMVKEWWKQMQKIVTAKQKFRLDAKRQEAINDHLGKVIETTQKYTEWLTEDLKMITSGDNETSTDDDPEFKVIGELTDDEETIDKDEMEMEDNNTEEEIEALHRQNQMSLEDILNELPDNYFKVEVNNNENKSSEDKEEVNYRISSSTKKTTSSSKEKEELLVTEQNNDNDDNFKCEDEECSEDCEDTMIEQETFDEEVNDTTGDNMEINDLMMDAETPIEELLKLYKQRHSVSDINDSNEEENNNSNNIEYRSNSSSSILSDSEDQSSVSSGSTDSSYESSVDLGLAFNIDSEKILEEKPLEFEGQFEEITEVALSTQPRGFTLESTEVKVQVPFLLKFSLREYQHVGLDWMAAMYEKRLNGVLADEMGLGKTIQTIALLAYLSCEKSIWGPHLVVVPTSVVLNWEIEFKKWCPGFKILTYFGSLKERKEKRKGWTKTNAFHVCITSYKLAIQDCQAFKRKKWRYMILDEAQNIKNFKSQRWQTLLTFNSQRRLLLTGTPLQNNLMELWSLMHFLMPNIFQSHREFNEWFGSPLSGMVEGSNEYNDQLVMRLHKVLRPFILRRLKKDVEKQMPQKYEHLVMCSLSKRQRFLYDDYMSLTSTKEMLSSGQFMSIISILMQLRKVCNHPNLFEDRPTLSPFSMTREILDYNYPRMLLIDDIYDNRMTNGRQVLPCGINSLAEIALNLPKFVSERIFGLFTRPNLIEEVDNVYVSDWVSKFDEKFTDCRQNSAFIPRDLIDYLKKSENTNDKEIHLPTPLIYGLKIKKSNAARKENILPESIITSRRVKRVQRLQTIGHRNVVRCSQYTSMGIDVVEAVTIGKYQRAFSWDIMTVNVLKPRTLEQFIDDNIEIVDKVTFVIPAVLSSGIRINTSARSLLSYKTKSEEAYCQYTCSIPRNLSRTRQNQLVQFPDTRLIEYDCGKLQILVPMLKRLKSEGHRCLIFTQMTRMLDVLEQFLSYHGYRYLRLDGTTKIEQRQIMMEQFNKDERIFVFILSTRSGGVGVNLTGADTVIFYDSDWNPTMDAQAQDRCHRIGQTRDVHIYRLISRMTIEENILKKANEKRHLNEMAIEGGQFNMAFFKSNTLQDIFETPTGMDNVNVDDDKIIKTYKTIRGRTIKCKGDKSIFNFKSNNEHEKVQSKIVDSTQFEAALEEVEDESDRLATKITRAEAKADLVEFDETVPWEDNDEGSNKPETDENRFRLEMESQLENFNSQLNPLQKYGVGWIEQSSENVLCFQLELEESQIENNKQTWELDQIKALHEDQEEMKNIEEDDMLYIYGSYDPYAAQREELEKMRKEEDLRQLQELRREEELAKREKDKIAAQTWAQEQHRNALKRKSEIINEELSDNFSNSDMIVKSPKQRKIVITRMELPDESITTVKNIIITSNADEIEQPLHSSSSSSINIDNIPFPAKRRGGRPPWKNISKRTSEDWNCTDKNSDKIVLTPKRLIKSHWDNNSLVDSEMDYNDNPEIKRPSPSSRRYNEFQTKDTPLMDDQSDLDFVPSKKSFPQSRKTGNRNWKNLESDLEQTLDIKKSFPQARRMGRPPWKNIKLINDDEYHPKSQIKRSSFTRRYVRQSRKHLQMEEHISAFPRKMSLPPSRSVERLHRNSSMVQNSVTRSPDENIAPYDNEIFNSSNFANPFTQTLKTNENLQNKNVYHKREKLNKSDDFIKDSMSVVNNCNYSSKKKRGRPSLADMKKKVSLLANNVRNRNGSESTNTSTILNKKNSFKIPVKTLNGEHKLFSAPLLLLKTKPVFVVTRKIEDNNGNVYTQNLTYPIECNDNFNVIAAKLSSFASNVTDK